jgi:hypothetical protein
LQIGETNRNALTGIIKWTYQRHFINVWIILMIHNPTHCSFYIRGTCNPTSLWLTVLRHISWTVLLKRCTSSQDFINMMTSNRWENSNIKRKTCEVESTGSTWSCKSHWL